VKKPFVLALIALVIPFASFAQQGPLLDKIVFDARSQEDVGLKDVAEGLSDFWNYPSSGSVLQALPDDVRNKLDIYTINGTSTDSLLLNPVPDAAPYQVKTPGGQVVFNPFALREVRYAMNWLLNRKKIVDEILKGAGQPLFGAVPPGQPNASKYEVLAGKLGMTAGGNEERALADIEAALTTASKLPENAGKLVKQGHSWMFAGEPVTVKFLIRADDPQVRLPLGRYAAAQIEKTGIRVECLEYDRAKCLSLYKNTDPADYQWNLYTEAWVGGQPQAFWETPRLPKAPDLGLGEGVRVYLVSQASYLASNRARFRAKKVFGLGEGINKWFWYTADVRPETRGVDQGLKVARMTGFSPRGGLFLAAWDPIGPDGFGDTSSSTIVKFASDQEYEANPITGIPIPLRAHHKGLTTDVKIVEGSLVGQISVPPEAVLWNAKTQRWETGVDFRDVNREGSVYDYQKADGNTASSAATFSFLFGKWHHGRPVDLNDYRYALAFPYDIAVKKGSNDRVFDESYASVVRPRLIRTKGAVFHQDNTITLYADVDPMDENSLAAILCPRLTVQASHQGAILPWEILEALKAIVAEGSASKTVYAYNAGSDFTEVDLLSQKSVDDLRAKLIELAAAKRVPAPLAGFLTPDQATSAYTLAVKWIETHGHGYISNGGFYLDRYDPTNNTGVLIAFRDKAYPYAKGFWVKALVAASALGSENPTGGTSNLRTF